MISCGGDVALAGRDRGDVLTPSSFKLFERLAARPAIDVANAIANMKKPSFRKVQELHIES